ncbi:hypothetical protein L288_18525 [Sphingobium quisquiliarum P25]|uniref:Uncharacterized protein n=1 Tax=Sphingobium quisquiliarum P25 TaxID=1329909 RepID=T0HRR0_9SPHN|nr:hypothetical protein [Sphingobium quisquiliarum]EQB00234.1 hypothetical protein L288_18525 [Sphingobium quisquiliarum P25]
MKKIMGIAAATTALLTAIAPSAAMAKGKPRDVWSVTRSSDPITGTTSCVVTAYDTAAGMKFSRMGFLYPIVENNPKLGLLIGVSSGGRYRLPTGDILWRVDDNPHRELKAADNPAVGGTSFGAAFKTGNEATDRQVEGVMVQTAQLTASLTATSTVASGDKAREMLAEMAAGRSLIYRQEAASPAFGLPSARTAEVGQYTSKGQEPFLIDASFHRGLTECGIIPPASGGGVTP